MPSPAPARRHRRHTVMWSICGALALIVLGGAWLAFRVLHVRSAMTQARASLTTLSDDVRAGAPLEQQRMALAAVQRSMGSAHSAAHDPVWTVAAALPWAGQPLASARELIDAGQTLVTGAMPDVVTATKALDTIRRGPVDGALPLQPLQAAAPALANADADLATASARVKQTPPSWLGVVAQARDDLQTQLEKLLKQVHVAAAAARLAPGMLGADGPRRYFVAFENPAELRGGGGLLGGYAIVVADHGKLRLEKIGGEQDLPALNDAPNGLSNEWLADYQQFDAGTLWVNTNLSAHFPSTAAAWTAMYKQDEGVDVDGVLSVDPVALSRVMRVTGPVTLPGLPTVSADNVVQFLERDEYALDLPTPLRKALLGEIGKAVFTRLTSGNVDAHSLLAGLAGVARTGDLHLASSHPAEENVLAGYPIAGVLSDTTAPYAEALITNAAATKLDYYLHSSLTYRVDSCAATNRRVTITVTLRNAAPATALPAYASTREDLVPGKTAPRNSNRVWLAVLLTHDARFLSATLDGKAIALNADDPSALSPGRERNHPMLGVFVDLAQGQSRTLVLHLNEPPSSAAPMLPLQAMPNPPTASVERTSCLA